MRSFSLRGISTKGFYGPNAFSLGTGTTGMGTRIHSGSGPGATTGGVPLPYGSGNSSGGSGGGGGTTLSLFVTGDAFSRVFMSDLMTSQQQTDWQAGKYNTLNISASGSPPRGYWVITGHGDPTQPDVGSPQAFAFDLDPGIPVTINFDTSQIRIYGTGGSGASAPAGAPALFGGDAIGFIVGSATVMNLNIKNTNGANTGRVMGGGGGGGYNIGFQSTGGGGAAGWFQGWGDTANGATDGGIYDPANGGTGDPNVAGGTGGLNGEPGGALGVAGTNGSGSNGGAAGLAVNRDGQPGVTVITGGGANFIRGAVQ